MPGRPGNVVTFKTTDEGADQFASLLTRAVEHVNAEEGTTVWVAGRDEADATSFFIIDVFANPDGRSAHFGGQAAALILGEGASLLDGPPESSGFLTLATKGA